MSGILLKQNQEKTQMRLAPELKSKIDALWDKFWSGGLSNPLSSIEQMSYLIFMKRFEDMDAMEQKKALHIRDGA